MLCLLLPLIQQQLSGGCSRWPHESRSWHSYFPMSLQNLERLKKAHEQAGKSKNSWEEHSHFWITTFHKLYMYIRKQFSRGDLTSAALTLLGPLTGLYKCQFVLHSSECLRSKISSWRNRHQNKVTYSAIFSLNLAQQPADGSCSINFCWMKKIAEKQAY